jgi:hypothetical protein
MFGIELDQNINITLPSKVIPDHRTKKSRPADVVLLAKFFDLFLRVLN